MMKLRQPLTYLSAFFVTHSCNCLFEWIEFRLKYQTYVWFSSTSPGSHVEKKRCARVRVLRFWGHKNPDYAFVQDIFNINFEWCNSNMNELSVNTLLPVNIHTFRKKREKERKRNTTKIGRTNVKCIVAMLQPWYVIVIVLMWSDVDKMIMEEELLWLVAHFLFIQIIWPLVPAYQLT